MRPKPKYREMEIINPNKPPAAVESLGEDSAQAAGIYTLDQSETYGNPPPDNNSISDTWPEISYCRQNAHNRTGLRICEIEVSRWSSSDYDLAGLKLKNVSGDNSEIIGRTLHSWETIELHN